ncbi:chlorohydrolase [Streptococcus pneumoniae]|nr:chlorohydrolase [Streptococcus pneumoniae]
MKIKDQTRKLATGCSKHCFEVVDRTDEVTQNTVLRLQMKLTKSVHLYGKATLTRFEEIFEEYKKKSVP